MVDENRLRLFLEGLYPVQKALLVGVAARAVQDGDLGVHGNILAEQPHLLHPVQQRPPQRALGLIARDEDDIFRHPEIVLQMVPDAARVAHAAGRQDDLGARIAVDGLGLLDRDRKLQSGAPDGVLAAFQDGLRLRVKAVGIAL